MGYTMKATIKLHMDVCRTLCDIENNGIKVDVPKLLNIEKDFRNEHTEIERELNSMIIELCGDTPINLASAEDRSKLFYSKIVINKKRMERNI